MNETEALKELDSLIRAQAERYKYIVPGVEKDDLIQEGRIGALTAIRSFNPSFKTKLSSHAFFYIRTAITTYVMKERYRRMDSTDVQTDDMPFSETFGTPTTPLHSMLTDELYEFILSMPERDQKIFDFVNGGGFSFRQVASIIGVSEQRVGQIHADIIRKIKEFITNGKQKDLALVA